MFLFNYENLQKKKKKIEYRLICAKKLEITSKSWKKMRKKWN